MAEFNYDNIDLFYYHAIDIEFSRLVSILENGIVSNHKAKELNLPYFYRNYKKASNRDYYVSISHFPNSILRYYKVDNELYNNSKNKITFVLKGDINAIEKQHCKKRYEYTNERHVYEGIDKENIVGILVSEYMLDKKISEIPFNNGFTDEVFI